MSALPVDAPTPTRRRVDYACALQIHRRIRKAHRRDPADRIVLWACTVGGAAMAVMTALHLLPS